MYNDNNSNNKKYPYLVQSIQLGYFKDETQEKYFNSRLIFGKQLFYLLIELPSLGGIISY